MIYTCIDLETTGVPGKDGPIEDLQILEFGAVIEDSNNPLHWDDIPKYNKIILHDNLQGGVFALNMNQRIIKILADRMLVPKERKTEYDSNYGIIKLEDLANDFFNFLFPYYGQLPEDEFDKAIAESQKYKQTPFYINVAGKNFDNFDRKFINTIPKFDSYVRMRNRTIDPTTSYIDWTVDNEPPGLGKCLERAGIIKTVSHKAVEDCWDTIQVLRKEYLINKPWMKK